MTAWLQAPGGIETHLLALAKLLTKVGCDVTIAARVCYRGVPLESEAPQIPIQFLKTPFSRNRRWLRLSTAWAMLVWPFRMRGKFDVIYTYELSGYMKFLRRFLKPGGQVIGSWVGELPGPEAVKRAQYADVLTLESEMHRERFAQLMGSKPPVVIIVIPPLTNVRAVARRRSLSRDELRVGYLGRYDEAKGIFRLLEMWGDLDIRPARLEFHGRGPAEQRLRAAVARHPRHDEIKVHSGYSGPEELTEILSNIDLLLLPSQSEGLPGVLVEAMAHGVPFVASDAGAVPTLAEDNPDVAVVPLEGFAGAVEAMARRIREGNIDPLRLQQYFDERYSYAKVTEQWLELLLGSGAARTKGARS